MKIKEQLARLVRIQDLAVRTRQAREQVESSPQRLQEIEQHFRDRNAEYVAVRERFDALEADQRHRNSELTDLEVHRKKYMDDLMQVSNQREYAAMLREIDTVKAQISAHEDAILKNMEEIEAAKTDLAAHEEHIQEERKRVEAEREEVEAETKKAQEEIDRLTAERHAIEAELPDPILATVTRLEEGRGGQFMSSADEGVCQSCFVRVRPQVFQEIRLASRIHTCSNCRRILFYEPTLRSAESKEGSGNVEAVP